MSGKVVGKVVVIDYGIGNLHSVIKALRHEGAEVEATADHEALRAADRAVLPGVGGFADGMRGLRERGLVEPIREFVASGRPFLGICLGQQLLLSESEEFGLHEGLGIVPGRVVALKSGPGAKVPHIGWNRLLVAPGAEWKGTLLEGIAPGTMVYFVHSYAVVPEDAADRLAETAYGENRMASVIRRGNVSGCQFHPEKSGPGGLAMLRYFLSS